VPLRAALIACCLLAVPLAGCSGDDADPSGEERLLAPSSFREIVVAELKGAGLEAEAGPELEVRASRGPDRVDRDLAPDYARYEESPGDEEEIVASVVSETEERLTSGLGGLSLDDVRSDLMPLLKAPFELRTYGFEPAQTPFPGRLAVVYAVDRPDDFTLVRPDDVERWGTTVEELHAVAEDNLLRRTNRDEPLLCEPSGEQELCGWASGDGYDATRMIVPQLRRQIERELGGPAVYAVPMEHVFVALLRRLVERGRTEELFRVKVSRDFQTSDDPLSPEIFAERDGELALLP
jgi:uncharacterized protein YtpQ (UPF0354 family)